MEMLAITVIGIVAPFIAIITYQIFQERKENRKIAYKKWEKRFFKRNPEMRIKPVAQEKENKGLIDLLTNLDKNKIKGILGALQDNTYEEEEEETLVDSVLKIAKDNPELVKGFLDNLNKVQQTSNTETIYES